MTDRIHDIAFTPLVKARQEQMGSRRMFDGPEGLDFAVDITKDLAAFIAHRDSFYMATVSEFGHPYIQHRGGPRGFLKVIDSRTLGFADLRGNRQYISTGNLDASDKVHLFLMDYANHQRIKIWGRARIIEDDAELLAELTMPDTKVKAERAVLITVDAWDVNCPQHIPDLYPPEVIRQATRQLAERIAALEAENAELKKWLDQASPK